MRTARVLLSGAAAISRDHIGAQASALLAQQQPPAARQPAVQINATAIGGVVTSRFGPEAGVWVIAETTDLPSKFAKVVVTDERGRYVIPDLPAANYKVWVRGYGLVDSPKVDAKPGTNLNLTAVIAPTAKDAAQYYPPMYWYSMVKIPGQEHVPGDRAERQRHPNRHPVARRNTSTRRCSTAAATATSSATTRRGPFPTTSPTSPRWRRGRERVQRGSGRPRTWSARWPTP